MNVKHTKLWLVVSAAVFLMSMPFVSSADCYLKDSVTKKNNKNQLDKADGSGCVEAKTNGKRKS